MIFLRTCQGKVSMKSFMWYWVFTTPSVFQAGLLICEDVKLPYSSLQMAVTCYSTMFCYPLQVNEQIIPCPHPDLAESSVNYGKFHSWWLANSAAVSSSRQEHAALIYSVQAVDSENDLSNLLLCHEFHVGKFRFSLPNDQTETNSSTWLQPAKCRYNLSLVQV